MWKYFARCQNERAIWLAGDQHRDVVRQFFRKCCSRQARARVCGSRCRYKTSTLKKCQIMRASPIERRNIHDASRPRRSRGNRGVRQARNFIKREACGLS